MCWLTGYTKPNMQATTLRTTKSADDLRSPRGSVSISFCFQMKKTRESIEHNDRQEIGLHVTDPR